MKSASYVCLSVLLFSACSPERTSESAPSGVPETAVVANPPWPASAVIPKLQSGHLRNQLDASQISVLSRQGLAGDATSASLLMRLYAEQRDTVLYDKWLQIAAENGDPMAMGIKALDLEKAGGEENCLRAKAWHEHTLRQARSGDGFVDAPTANLQALAASWDECVMRGAADTDSH